MTLKERILNDYFTRPFTEYTVFQTTQQELSRMYDEVVEVVKSGQDFKRFLGFKGAITSEGKIRFDRESMYIDPDDKKKVAVKTKVVFKYPIYSFFYQEYTDAIAAIKEKESKILLPVI